MLYVVKCLDVPVGLKPRKPCPEVKRKPSVDNTVTAEPAQVSKMFLIKAIKNVVNINT